MSKPEIIVRRRRQRRVIERQLRAPVLRQKRGQSVEMFSKGLLACYCFYILLEGTLRGRFESLLETKIARFETEFVACFF